MNKKYLVFGLAAVIAIAGVVYFKTGANQQASVLALNSKPVSNTADTALTGAGPITNNPNDPSWIKLCRDRKPHIQVLSPNGGEVYQAGQQINVKWRSCNISGAIAQINLTSTRDNGWGPGSGPNAGKYTFITNTLNDGQELVTLPDNNSFATYGASFGKYFKAEVNTSTASDSSNNLFTINALAAGAAVTELVSFTYNDNYNSDIGTHINTEITSNIRVTAQGSDMFIPRSVKVGTSLTDTNVGTTGFVIVPLNVGYVFDPSVSIVSNVSIMSGGIIDSSGRIKITKGQSANLRIVSVVTAPVGSGMKAIQLNALGAAETASGALISYPTLPASAYRSGFTQGF